MLPSILDAKYSQYLTDEKNAEAIKNKKDPSFDFTVPGATIFFLDNIVTREMFESYPELREFLPIFDDAFLNAYERTLDVYPRIMEPEEP